MAGSGEPVDLERFLGVLEGVRTVPFSGVFLARRQVSRSLHRAGRPPAAGRRPARRDRRRRLLDDARARRRPGDLPGGHGSSEERRAVPDGLPHRGAGRQRPLDPGVHALDTAARRRHAHRRHRHRRHRPARERRGGRRIGDALCARRAGVSTRCSPHSTSTSTPGATPATARPSSTSSRFPSRSSSTGLPDSDTPVEEWLDAAAPRRPRAGERRGAGRAARRAVGQRRVPRVRPARRGALAARQLALPARRPAASSPRASSRTSPSAARRRTAWPPRSRARESPTANSRKREPPPSAPRTPIC